MERMRTPRQVILEAEEEGGYHIYCPSLPGCHSQGETIDEALANIKEAIDLFIEDMVDNGETVPEDARAHGRAPQDGTLNRWDQGWR